MKYLIAVLLILCNYLLLAQGSAAAPEMADVMRSNGKIYVVVVVLSIIFAGIVLFLISIDRKVRRLEKKS